jgi:hypothetical protein
MGRGLTDGPGLIHLISAADFAQVCSPALPPGPGQDCRLGRGADAARAASARPSSSPVAGCQGASAAAVHRIAGRPCTDCEQVYSAGQKRNLKLSQKTRNGTINRGDKSQCTKSESVRCWGRCPLPVFEQRCDVDMHENGCSPHHH